MNEQRRGEDHMMMSEFDPSLRDGGRLVFEGPCAVELRLPATETEDAVSGGNETLLVKIVAFYEEDEVDELHSVVLEALSESDVFFHYVREIRRRDFEKIRASQNLVVEFEQFPSLLTDLSKATDPHVRCTFVLVDGNAARIEFVSLAHTFRRVELLTLHLDLADQRDTQLLVSYRFNELKSRLAFAQTRYENLAKAVQTKYPHILSAREGDERHRLTSSTTTTR